MQLSQDYNPMPMNTWQPADTAPKGEVIIACFNNFPMPVVATWNAAEEQWVISNAQVNFYQGKWNDTYFETEYETAGALKYWMPMPNAA